MADFRARDEGSIWLLTPITAEAKAWADEYIATNDETQQWAGALVIEHRYIGSILEGAAEAGLRVRVS